MVGDGVKSFDHLLTVDEFEAAAARLLTRDAYDYYRSGADDQRTLRGNRKAWSRYEIWYRVLVDVAERSIATRVLDVDLASPILVAPTAYHRLAHPEGEVATARGAAAAGTLYVASTLATTRLEEAAKASSAPKWFQLYVHKDRGFTRELVLRAAAAGYRAIVLTVDAPILGRRLADERNRFSLPNGLTMANMAPEASEADDQGSMLANHMAARHDATLSWRDLDWLRGLAPLPLLLKGIVRSDDAERAVGAGVDGIVVSNHGARQLDTAPATADALPPIVAAVAGRCPVLVDGGIRRGTDVLKALALGATAVLVGRPVLYGLAVGGEEGVTRVLELLANELRTAMALAGVGSIAALREGDLVRRRAR